MITHLEAFEFKNLHKLKHILLSTLVLGVSIAQNAHANEDEARAVYMDAIEKSKLIRQIHDDGFERRKEESRQLKALRSSVTNNDSLDLETLREKVTAELTNDIHFFNALNKDIESYNKAGQVSVSYQLSVNKMELITRKALALAENEELFYQIIQEGDLPKGYSIAAPEFNYFPNEDHIFSSGNGPALKSLLLKVWMIQNGVKSVSQVASLFEEGWLSQCPFLHINALPDDFCVMGFQSTPHFFSDKKTPNGLITTHNGYAWGGQLGETRNPEKKWAPEDCTSFVKKYLGSTLKFDTRAQAQLYQLKQGFQLAPYSADPEGLVKIWESERDSIQRDPEIAYLGSLLKPLQPILQDDLHVLKPGMVHAEVYYDKTSVKEWNRLTGTSGHTGFFLGTVGSGSNAKALTITAGRDLEAKESREFVYGVEERELFSDSKRFIMFFDNDKK